MAAVNGTIDIARPVADVFAYLSEPKNNLEWESDVLEMELTSDGPVGVGSTGRRVDDSMGRDEGTWEVTEFEQDKTIAMTFESGKFTGGGGWGFEPTDGGTRLSYTFRGTPKNPIFKIIMPLMMPMFRRRVSADYEKLKGILESQA